MVKILLTSDIHLGSEEIPESFRLKTFKKLSYLAKSHDIFIIAGDLFHTNGINEKSIDFVASEFKNLRDTGIEIVYTLGDCELNGNNASLLQKLNVSKLFSDDGDFSPYHLSRDNQDIYIYGLPACSKRSIPEIKKSSDSGFHIGLFHADFNLNEKEEIRENKISVINKEDIISLNFDFYALGHNHYFKLFKYNGRYIGAYPGSPEAVTFNENGDRYAISISIKDNEIYQIKRLTVNSAKLESIEIDCSQWSDTSPITDILKEKNLSDSALKLKLTGKRNFKFDRSEINKLYATFKNIYIQDASIPTINVFISEFAGEESLRGEFFSMLNSAIKNNELPANIDMDILSDIFNKVLNSGFYKLEDLCNYWNA
ncbi:MAG: metallophosphoesterase [Spirochaetota bacterium]